MSESHAALRVDVGENLLPFSVLLRERGVAHRIFEESGQQVLSVARPEQAAEVEKLYRRWRDGEFRIELVRREEAAAAPAVPAGWRAAPVTVALIALSIAGFLLVGFFPRSLMAWLTFTPFEIRGDELVLYKPDRQYWRLFTPVFLHFGWLHIAFNCLWLWELGRRVEQVLGGAGLFILFLAVAVLSNLCQFYFGGPGLFGGMSGVVYGLLGFAWFAPLFQPRWQIQPTRAIMLFMVGWLFACMAGLVEALGFGAIANAAHVGGLVVGGALGALLGLMSGRGDRGRTTRV